MARPMGNPHAASASNSHSSSITTAATAASSSSSSASSAASSTVPSTATSATSPDARPCPPISLSHPHSHPLALASPPPSSSASPPSAIPLSVNITSNHIMSSAGADITSPIGTKPSTVSVSSSLAQPFPAPAALSVSTWNSLGASSLAAKTAALQLSDTTAPTFADRRASDLAASILIRKLPLSMSQEGLRCILLFASDLVDVHFINYSDDLGFQTAVAKFGSVAGATDACTQLHGKTIYNQDSSLIVELLPNGYSSGGTTTPAAAPTNLGSIGAGRHSRFFNTNNSHHHTASSSAAANISLNTNAGVSASVNNAPATAHPSSQNAISASTWLLNTSAPLSHGMSHPASAIDPPTSSLFSPPTQNESPNRFADMLAQSSVINSFSGFPTSLSAIPREDKNAIKPPAHLGAPVSMSQPSQQTPLLADPVAIRALQVGMNSLSSPPPSAAANARNIMHPAPLSMPSNVLSQPGAVPASAITPATGSGNLWFSTPQQTPTATSFPRHNLPPINPADQNPPCNTLYVGNLPLDTSEDELKAMFSKQRGFKRLCFRVKHNGPMCFVEFEDVSFATKALNDLYGYPLHNSVKGGIRLSFSKNPLGVRSGQNPANGLAHGMHPRLSTVNGPPPGLPAPGYYSANSAVKNANNPGCNTSAANLCYPYSADPGRNFDHAPWNQPVGYPAQYHTRPIGRQM